MQNRINSCDGKARFKKKKIQNSKETFLIIMNAEKSYAVYYFCVTLIYIFD